MAEPLLFRAGEILDMAVGIERKGMEFYKACSQALVDQRVKEIFEILIEQEQKHIETFTRMKEGLEDYPLPESYPGEMRRYLDSFVKDQVFQEPDEAASQAAGIDDPQEAIDLAVGFERSSILFYSGMKQVVRSSEREKLEEIITEEHRHIRMLLNLLRELES